MNKTEITIDNKTYPCRLTMGAYLRYKRETGKDFTEDKVDNASVCTLMWCSAVSSTKHDLQMDFPLSLEEFADSIDPATAGLWFTNAMEGVTKATEEAVEEKKRQASQKS